jgi:hypothetical protein
MGKLLKYAAVLILAASIGFLYMVNEESFFTDQEKFSLFNSYLKRASDPHEKRLRLAETKKVAQSGVQGLQTMTTLEFVDEKVYLEIFTKTYRLHIRRQAYVDNHDTDWIEAALFLAVDYGTRKEHEVIYSTRRIMKNDADWNILVSLFDNPVHRLKKKNLLRPEVSRSEDPQV